MLQARLGARIAIGVERKHEAPGVIEEHVVDPPGVDADRGEARAAGQGGGGEAQAGLHLMPQGADVPVVMRAERAEGVGKAVDLFQTNGLAVPDTGDDAAAFRAEIDREIDAFRHVSS